jgi:ribosomal protein S18 acetylase RimI-like enzyme
MSKATAKPSKTRKTTSNASRKAAGVRVREAALGDAGALTELRRQAERTHARLMPDYFREAPADAAGSWTPGRGPWSTVLVATLAAGRGNVVGFVAVKVVVTPRDPAMVPRRRAHLEIVVVDEDHRDVGIGTALMQAATGWARERGAEEMVLTVWSDNAAAEALYRGLGYEPIARVLRRQL